MYHWPSIVVFHEKWDGENCSDGLTFHPPKIKYEIQESKVDSLENRCPQQNTVHPLTQRPTFQNRALSFSF